MAWHGTAWHGMARHGMARHGMAWHGVARHGMTRHITAHHITSHHITAHHITSHHGTSHHITSHHITAHHITAHHIMAHHITAHHITAHHITAHHITAHHGTSHHGTSHHVTSRHVTSRHITAHHITSHHITSHHITAHHITAHHGTSHHGTSHHGTSHHGTSRHITSRHITSRHITARHITAHHGTSHHVTSRHVTSRHITSRHITSRHITSRHITSRHITSRHITSRHGTRCALGFTGQWCEAGSHFTGAPCINNCSGRGRCDAGTCVCPPGFFGADCSLQLDSHGVPRVSLPDAIQPPVSSHAPLRPRVYVYDLPPRFTSWILLHGHSLDRPEPLHFYERLLASPYRTADGHNADFYFVPIFLRMAQSHALLDSAIRYISTTWPYWNGTHAHHQSSNNASSNSGGRNHLFYASNDWGMCETFGGGWGYRDPLLLHASLLTLWGHRLNMFKGATRPCFIPGQDVLLPPEQGERVLRASPYIRSALLAASLPSSLSSAASPSSLSHLLTPATSPTNTAADVAAAVDPLALQTPILARPYLAFFRGFFSNWDELPPPTDIPDARPLRPYVLSFGVRQLLFDLFVNFTATGGVKPDGLDLEGVSLVPTTGAPQGFIEEMQRSRFCLAPAGFGWAMRTTQAVLLGCIPVILQDDVEQPFEGELIDWDAIAVRVSYSDIPRLFDILRSIPDAEVERLHAAGAAVWPRFVHLAPHLHQWLQVKPGEEGEDGDADARRGGSGDERVARALAPALQSMDMFESLMEVLRRRVLMREKGKPPSG
ncbi:hypothetical protein CLOM_g18764 [Closterium sp. NIES-68]|nr:hypothetical protein CLOM_g18764 [Closterium sp. NIES-68]GJP62417.1 hypothetical protein CLOP_g19483 [Closterium sp. NIES-67]